MTTKYDVVPYLVMGMSPNDIAQRLNCCPAYVRAVKAREFGRGKEVARRSYHKRKRSRATREYSL
mgnify:CR=1 FL=1